MEVGLRVDSCGDGGARVKVGGGEGGGGGGGQEEEGSEGLHGWLVVWMGVWMERRKYWLL